MPLTLKQGQAPRIQFGQTYQELAQPWKLAPWPEDDNPPFFLLPHSVVARSEIMLFNQPFLCRFSFDKPGGRLLAVDMVHWEKGNSRRVQKTEKEFTQAMLNAYGQVKPKISQADKRKIISYEWPGITFNNQHDEGGQTWYITFSAAARNTPTLEDGTRGELAQRLGLEPYFEPDSPLPTVPGREYSLNLSCSPMALRTYYLFSGYDEKARLVGVKMVLPQQSVAGWLDCRLEQLKQSLELKYGKPKTVKPNHFMWQGGQASLSLRQVNSQAWLLELLAHNTPGPASESSAGFPPQTNDIAGWDNLQWNMSPSRALALYPHITQTAYARAGGQGSFFAGTVNYNEIPHELRLSFGNLGLEEISLAYAGHSADGQPEQLKLALEKRYGSSDWQHNSQDDITYYWSRASGYLQFTIFKEPAPSWRIILKPRQPVAQ